MLRKNLVWYEKLWKLPLRFILDFVFAFKNLFSGYPASFIAVIKAYAAVIKWSLTKHAFTTSKRKPMNKLKGVFSGSIIRSYFIEKKKRFSEIVKKNL